MEHIACDEIVTDAVVQVPDTPEVVRRRCRRGLHLDRNHFTQKVLEHDVDLVPVTCAVVELVAPGLTPGELACDLHRDKPFEQFPSGAPTFLRLK
nr:hypothetical protein [Myceligenerans indicum]